MKRIVCIGNHSVDDTTAGPLVGDLLAARELPPGVDLLLGGSSGLDLFKAVIDSDHVIFVDTVSGFNRPGAVVLIRDVAQVIEQISRAGQGIGPANRSALLSLLNSETGPGVVMVGLEPPSGHAALWRAAEMSLLLAGCDMDSGDLPVAASCTA